MKTEEDIWSIANSWHRRTHRLRDFWQDSTQPYDRRDKAFRLWLMMMPRTMHVMTLQAEIMRSRHLMIKLGKGGVRLGGDIINGHISDQETMIQLAKWNNSK